MVFTAVAADNGHLWYSEWDTVDRGNKDATPMRRWNQNLLDAGRWSIRSLLKTQTLRSRVYQ